MSGGEDGVAGEESGLLSQIGKFTDGSWSNGGQLKSVRIVSFRMFQLFHDCRYNFKTHRAQWFDNALVVAGGLGTTGEFLILTVDSTDHIEHNFVELPKKSRMVPKVPKR